jgi:hypothetical protein
MMEGIKGPLAIAIFCNPDYIISGTNRGMREDQRAGKGVGMLEGLLDDLGGCDHRRKDATNTAHPMLALVCSRECIKLSGRGLSKKSHADFSV